jgi:hypothetical protein
MSVNKKEAKDLFKVLFYFSINNHKLNQKDELINTKHNLNLM